MIWVYPLGSGGGMWFKYTMKLDWDGEVMVIGFLIVLAVVILMTIFMTKKVDYRRFSNENSWK